MPDFQPIAVAPGVVSKPTKSEASASWREANLVRWDSGIMEPLKGWAKFAYTPPSKKVRAIHVWRDNVNTEWTAYLCDGALYVEYQGDLYDISPTPAMAETSFGTGGYGDSTYDTGSYGDPRPSRPGRRETGPAFTLDNWGENLLAMSSADGRLLEWAPSLPPNPAAAVLNAPTGRTFVVTPERFVMVFQPDGAANEFAWCDQEDNTNWNFADITSKAGKYNIQPASPILAALNLGDLGGSLFFTARKAYVSRFVGMPYVYDQGTEIGDGVTPISAGALTRTAFGAEWFTESGFFRFDGTTPQKIACDVWSWIKDHIDFQMARFTAVAIHIPNRSEVWYFFPSTGSLKNDRMVIHNYTENWWSMGKLSRSAGYAGSFASYPVMADDFAIYQHDGSTSYPDAPEKPWAETFTINARGGAGAMTFKQLKPDVDGDHTNLRYSLAVRDVRTPDDEYYTAQRSIQPNGCVDFDVTGRDFRLRVDYVGGNVLPWTMGELLIDVKPRGKR